MTPTDPIRAALERFIALVDEDLLCPGNPAETDWGAVKRALADARVALAEQQSDGPALSWRLSAAPLEVKGASDKELLQIAEHAACIDDIQESWEEMLPIELTATEILNICRAVLARWGCQPARPAEGEVGELVGRLSND